MPNRAPRADLGELRLSAEPLPELAQPLEHLLVSGRVVDQAGRPLDRVYLTLRGLEDQRLWARCHSDASGGFELRHGEPGPFYLDLELDGYQTLHLPRLQPGSADQVYVLDEAGSIEGKLRDDLVPVQDGLRIHAHRDGEVHRGRIRGDKLSVAGLAPGTYDLVLGTETWDREFLRVEGVEVVAGEATADPRLADLCASDLARVLRVRVEGQDGTPLEYEDLRVFLPSGEQARVETALLGMLRILVPVDTTWVELGRGPQGRVRVELGDEDQTMRL